MTKISELSQSRGVIPFLNSERGRLIMSQALWLAVKSMREIPLLHRESSKIYDMEKLLKAFPQFSEERKHDGTVRRTIGLPYVCLNCTEAFRSKKQKPKICPKCKNKDISRIYRGE